MKSTKRQIEKIQKNKEKVMTTKSIVKYTNSRKMKKERKEYTSNTIIHRRPFNKIENRENNNT